MTAVDARDNRRILTSQSASQAGPQHGVHEHTVGGHFVLVKGANRHTVGHRLFPCHQGIAANFAAITQLHHCGTKATLVREVGQKVTVAAVVTRATEYRYGIGFRP